jgi:hypothetical protein
VVLRAATIFALLTVAAAARADAPALPSPLPAPSVPSPSPTIEIYTMGPGADLFSAFGHAAICVRDRASPGGRCYNYGTADFRTPVPLGWDFIRGRARFWVSVIELPWLMGLYARDDRSVFRQVLTLPPAQAERLSAALAASTDERVKYYRYHHFEDNCTTRIRDLVDRATDGALERDPVDRGHTFRAWAREGFRGNGPLLVVVELILGRSADRPTDTWSAMFLPSELRATIAERLHAKPEEILHRRAPVQAGSRWLGVALLALGGTLLALVVIAGARLGGAWWRAALALTGLALGLIGTILFTLAALSSFPELIWNESLLAFWPTDLLLPLLPRRWLTRYLTLRLAVLALVVIGHVFGLTQPPGPLLLVLPPLLVAHWQLRAWPMPAASRA